MQRLGIIAIGLVLVFAAALQWVPRKKAPVSAGRSQLSFVPAAGNGWTAKDVPLGNTEALAESVADVLRYDDFVFREYRSSHGTFSLYAAYWAPGKMPTQLVASHTPDRCWTSAGWRCTEQVTAYSPLATAAIRPGQGRIFVQPANVVQYVVFWHLVGDKLYDYGDRFNAVPSPWKWWRDSARQIFESPAEQYFIRLSSDQPFERLADDPAFRAVIAALGKLGLAVR